MGAYTAAAVASIAFGESVAVVDGNVERVLLRILGLPEDKSAAGRAQVHEAAQALVPPVTRARKGGPVELAPGATNPPGDHNQALMELGATLCLPREPLCLQCPVIALCRTRGAHPTLPRGQQQSRLAAHLLALRKRGLSTEVLLERRAANASLLPGLLELPPLPLAAVARREPVLRLRHGITNTNYLIQVYSEGAASSAPERTADRGEEASPRVPTQRAFSAHELANEDEAVFEAAPPEGGAAPPAQAASLLTEIPAAPGDLTWMPVNRLRELPLTGLARKCLQRLHVMPSDVRPAR